MTTHATVFEWLGSGNNARFILEGFLINLEIAVIAIVLSLVAGLALALLRLSRIRVVSIVTGAWVDVFRNLPLLLLILFLFLWIPQSARNTWEGAVPGWAPEAWQSGLMLAGLSGLVLYNSAVLAEIMRAGILSLPRGQAEAAHALGLNYRQAMRHVILPQGLRRSGVEISPWVAGVASLGLYTAAYVAEALRSGVFSVSKGQIEASLSLGFTYPETLRRIARVASPVRIR